MPMPKMPRIYDTYSVEYQGPTHTLGPRWKVTQYNSPTGPQWRWVDYNHADDGLTGKMAAIVKAFDPVSVESFHYSGETRKGGSFVTVVRLWS
jgi:hypothetical protein